MDTKPMRPYDGRSLTKISEENKGNEPLIQAINRTRRLKLYLKRKIFVFFFSPDKFRI
jgi:hypothetical protein